jgi:hypothetical protein
MADEKSSTTPSCSVADCPREVCARGFCSVHYKQARRRGELGLAPKPAYAPVCCVDGCDRPHEKRGYCGMHYRRLQRFGRLENVRQAPGSLVSMGNGYMQRMVDGQRKLEHVLIAEAALGRPLPPGAEVHHINEDKSDNRPENLVVCPDRQYHMLLHARQRAQDACGNANWKKCCHCKQYDDPTNMTGRATRGQLVNSYYHKACAAAYVKERKAARKST